MALLSSRFGRAVVVTHHAASRMVERGIGERELSELIDSGHLRRADAKRLWAYKHFPARNDNLLCAVLVIEGVVVIKTVMHRFEPEE